MTDLLERAARALREETAAQAEGNQFARARVLASLHKARVRRHKRFVFFGPLGLVFAAASAWGMASGRVPELVREVAAQLGFTSAPTEPTSKPAPARRPPPSAPAPAVEAAPLPSEPDASTPQPDATPEAPLPTESKPPRVRPRRADGRAPAPRRAAPSLPPPDDPGHALYRAAHQAHFVDRDPARALEGWEAYLAKTRGGRFALEARYNRALCLIRLGQHERAEAALAPFASGAHGDYRHDDATRLLDALAKRAR